MNLQHMNAWVWWGRFNLEQGQALRWRIGPLTLWLRRLPREWQLSHIRGEEPEDGEFLETGVPEQDWERSAQVNLERFVFRQTAPNIDITPVLADRPVVTRPLVPFHLSGGEEVTMYASSPLWVRVAAGGVFIKEIAIQRPSDTWFGPSTRSGELCYASQTRCRLSLDELLWRPYRAVTPLLIRNREPQPLLIERLNLPVAYLSLFVTEQARLWTQTVTIRRDQGSDAVMDVGTAPPAEAGPTRLLCRPRSEPEKGGVIRALTSLFG